MKDRKIKRIESLSFITKDSFENNNSIKIPNSTPLKIRRISNKIKANLKRKSYSPTINNELITLKSIERIEQMDCNTEAAFKLKKTLNDPYRVSTGQT